MFNQLCPKCGYREVSLIDDVQKPPVFYKVYVNRVEDLNTVFYRSPTAEIRIPEIGIELTPTSNSLPKITTIEGFLGDVLEIAFALSSPNATNLAIKSELETVLKGGRKVTFELWDEYGSSWVKAKEGTLVHVAHSRPK